MRYTLTLAIVLFTTLSAFSADTNEAVRAELLAFNDRFNEYAKSYNIEGITALYDEKGLWIAPKERPAPAKQTANKTLHFLTKNKGSLVHTVERLIISKDATQAVMIGDAMVLVEKAGLDFTGTYLFVLERRNDDWVIVTDMFNQHEKK